MSAELLTEREYQVLLLVAQGQRNRKIASTLNIGESTVETHLLHIFKKLNVRTRVEATLQLGQVERSRAQKNQGNPG
jgi:DNA-binding NarL/FixJ family response regulator